MKCYKVEYMDEEGDLNIDYVNAPSWEQAVEIARAIVGHRYFTVALSGI